MILTFAVNGTLLDETPFFEKLKALAEEPKLDADKMAFAYRFLSGPSAVLPGLSRCQENIKTNFDAHGCSV